MSPHRCVREERCSPGARFLSPGFCRDSVSGPAFQGLCKAINPDLVHSHTTCLSGGDDTCELIFELRDGS
ncbi:MAG: hypothetical protein SWK76_09265 [Actinomycetota bacterium]|nr:hypothetical protein [Actinomycetota bacterium]